MGLDDEVMQAIEAGRERLVELTSALIGFDTTAREGDEPARDERALQALPGRAAVAPPAPTSTSGSRGPTRYRAAARSPARSSFAGRPQLAARFAGSGGGRSLLLNGHIDVVPAEPRERWTSDPFRAEVRDGNLYGRGACDMKGGVAAWCSPPSCWPSWACGCAAT